LTDETLRYLDKVVAGIGQNRYDFGSSSLEMPNIDVKDKKA